MGNKVINTTSVKLQIYETSTDTQLIGMLGDVKEFEDGRKFRLCRNDTTAALEPAKLIQAKAYATTSTSLVVPTAAVAGATTLRVTVQVDVAENELQNGYFCVEQCEDGELGHSRKIKSNTAADFDAGEYTTLTFYDALTDSISTGSEGTWVYPIYKDILKDAAGAKVIGVTVCDVAQSVAATPVYYYFWAQVAGPCAVYADSTVTVGYSVVAGSSGGVKNTTGSTAIIGVAMQSITSGDVGWINLNLE